jgi:hypothetical protein
MEILLSPGRGMAGLTLLPVLRIKLDLKPSPLPELLSAAVQQPQSLRRSLRSALQSLWLALQSLPHPHLEQLPPRRPQTPPLYPPIPVSPLSQLSILLAPSPSLLSILAPPPSLLSLLPAPPPSLLPSPPRALPPRPPLQGDLRGLQDIEGAIGSLGDVLRICSCRCMQSFDDEAVTIPLFP